MLFFQRRERIGESNSVPPPFSIHNNNNNNNNNILKKDDFVNRNAFSEKKERKNFWAKILQKISREQGGTIVHWTCAHSRRREVAWPRWSSSLYLTTMVHKATPNANPFCPFFFIYI